MVLTATGKLQLIHSDIDYHRLRGKQPKRQQLVSHWQQAGQLVLEQQELELEQLGWQVEQQVEELELE